MLRYLTFSLMVLGYGVCIVVALIDQQYFQASVFLVVAALHAFGRWEKERRETANNRFLPPVIQLAIFYMGLALVIYLALRKP